MDDLALERRLGKIEGQLVAAEKIAQITQTAAMTAAGVQHAAVIEKLLEVKSKVIEQNGRIGKLESWRTQQGAVLTVLIGAGPFVFWAMNRWAG